MWIKVHGVANSEIGSSLDYALPFGKLSLQELNMRRLELSIPFGQHGVPYNGRALQRSGMEPKFLHASTRDFVAIPRIGTEAVSIEEPFCDHIVPNVRRSLSPIFSKSLRSYADYCNDITDDFVGFFCGVNNTHIVFHCPQTTNLAL